MGLQEHGVSEARLDLLDPPEHNQFNFPMDPLSLRALRARQVHQDQPDLEGVKGHGGIRDHPGGTDLLVLQANAVSKAETEYLEFRDFKDYQGLGEAAEQLTSDGETRRVPRPQAPNLFTLAELLVVIGAAPGELAISFVYPRNRSTRKNSSLEHNAILRYTGSSTRPSKARR